jgi:hypothetical protein
MELKEKLELLNMSNESISYILNRSQLPREN